MNPRSSPYRSALHPAALLVWCWLLSFLSARAEILLTETFAYSDGPIVEIGGAPWRTLTGTPAQIAVTDGALRLQEGEFEIVEAPLAGGPYEAGRFYAGFTVTVSALPSGAGSDFAAFSAANGPRTLGRVFTTRDGAAPGSFRIGVSTAFQLPMGVVPQNLELNIPHRVVVRLGLPFLDATVWVNPSSEEVGGQGSLDSTFPGVLAAFALRQRLLNGSGMGTMTVDDLVVATTFEEARSVPPTGATRPRLESPRLIDGVFAARARTSGGTSYTLERRLLGDDTWTAIGTQPGNGDTVEFTDPAPPGAGALYRLSAE